ncbi:MAG: hypothetical protein OEV94_01510 [Deltaproteobacteria bacterium]|nr:hypothetical protein [Deltaproteobacteria bacterium]
MRFAAIKSRSQKEKMRPLQNLRHLSPIPEGYGLIRMDDLFMAKTLVMQGTQNGNDQRTIGRPGWKGGLGVNGPKTPGLLGSPQKDVS